MDIQEGWTIDMVIRAARDHFNDNDRGILMTGIDMPPFHWEIARQTLRATVFIKENPEEMDSIKEQRAFIFEGLTICENISFVHKATADGAPGRPWMLYAYWYDETGKWRFSGTCVSIQDPRPAVAA